MYIYVAFEQSYSDFNFVLVLQFVLLIILSINQYSFNESTSVFQKTHVGLGCFCLCQFACALFI